MYLRLLQVRNLKRLRDFRLDFLHEGTPRMWTVLIGENGTAKTTLLQAIALAATGGKQVNTLAGPIVRHLRDRRAADTMSISARFEFSDRARAPKAHPFLKKLPKELGLLSGVLLEKDSTSLSAVSTYENLTTGDLIETERDPLDHAREKHTPHWFVAGYGISRALPDATYTPPFDRPSIERMQPSAQFRLCEPSLLQ